jgi:hypothetical protein
MAAFRTHIVLPAQLAQDMNELAGPRGPSNFVVVAAEGEVRRRSCWSFSKVVNRSGPKKNPPDMAEMGRAEWVRSSYYLTSAWLAKRDQNLVPK